jgi:hypothetical protein
MQRLRCSVKSDETIGAQSRQMLRQRGRMASLSCEFLQIGGISSIDAASGYCGCSHRLFQTDLLAQTRPSMLPCFSVGLEKQTKTKPAGGKAKGGKRAA